MLYKNLLNDPITHDIFSLVDTDRHYLGELEEKLPYDKRTIAIYISQMKLAGIALPNWERGEDRRWRHYWRASNNEWARLIRRIIEVKENDE